MKKKTKKKSGGGKGNVDFGKYLRGLNRHLDKAKEKAAEGGFDEFDDGRYQMRAVDAKIGVSKNKRVQVIISWKFLNGEYKGKEKLDFEGLTEDHLEYLLRKLDAMGYDTSEIEDMEEGLKDILADIKKTKPKCRVRLKTKGEFQNVYVDGLLEDEDEEEDEEEDEDEDSESEDEDDEDEEDEPKKKSKKSKKSKKDDDDDEDEENEDGDDDDDAEEEDEDEEDEDEEEEKPKKGKKSKKKKDDDDDDDEEEADEEDEDEEEDEEVEDEIDVVVGSIVKANSKKEGKVKGEVVELFESEGKVLIKTDKGKTLKLKADQILSVEESPAESVPKKKKKKKGKK